MYALTVTRHFAGYKPGDQITDEQAMKEILESDNASRVVRVLVPEEKPST